MENWKKCRFDFQTCLHSNQDYSETVKDISSEKIRHLENSILHNRLVPKLAPLPHGGHKKIRKKMCKTFACHCIEYHYKDTVSYICLFEMSKNSGVSTRRYCFYAKIILMIELRYSYHGLIIRHIGSVMGFN